MPEDLRPDFVPDWEICDTEDCLGIVAAEGYCLQHCARAAFFATKRPGDDLDLRGTKLDSVLLSEVLDAFRPEDGNEARFGRVRFDYAWFAGLARFADVHFAGRAYFEYALFSGATAFRFAGSPNGMSFGGARFEGNAEILGEGDLDFEDARFARQARFRVARDGGGVARCTGTRFEGGLVLEAPGSAVSLASTHFGAPSLVADARVTALSGSDVNNLVLSNCDLSECRFAGAHRLDQLRFDGRTRFARPDGWWRARRRMIADEPSGPPVAVVALYRSLRKSFEDSKNEPGAGDFYYGEMEARRHSSDASRAERTILWFYWLLSGYGQRASRAITGLVVLIGVVTVLLTTWGQDFGPAARTAVGAVVFRDDRLELTAAGEWTVLVARFLGPVFLALAVLAVRARVKR